MSPEDDSKTVFNPEESFSPLWRLIHPSYPAPPPSLCRLSGCSSKGPLNCSGCYNAAYCSREHQKQDWSSHRADCAPFKLVRRPGVGRHLVATRDIKPGEIILKEPPIAAGPKQYTAPQCLSCSAPVTLVGYRCSGCSWPLCAEGCEKMPIHKAECQVFKTAGIKPTDVRRREGAESQEPILEHPMYECVTPLRICLSMMYKPENWSVVENMETHRAERQLEENSLHNQHNVVNFLLKHAKLPQRIPNISEEHITRAGDVLDVNAFEIRGKGSGGAGWRGLYPLTAMMNSSCSPNTQNSIGLDLVCTVRAARFIKKGDEICDTYTSTLSNTLYRQKHLKSTKYFTCCCQRCQDPTELGSHFSTLICRGEGCRGYMLSTQDGQQWRCRKCEFWLSREQVAEEQEAWEERIDNTHRSTHAQEALLVELEKVYHPNHNLPLDVKFNLVPLYGRQTGKEEMLEEAERKQKLVENIISVMDLLIPGLFRIRGMMLVELYTTRLFLLRTALEEKKISKVVFIKRLMDLRPLLTEAKLILGWEPEGSIEHSRLQTVDTFLSQLDQTVQQQTKPN